MALKQATARQTLEVMGVDFEESMFSTGSTVSGKAWDAALRGAQALRMKVDKARMDLEALGASDAPAPVCAEIKKVMLMLMAKSGNVTEAQRSFT